jgi:hypothetical protein
MTKIHSHILGGAVVLSGLFASELAQAQDAPAAPAPAAPPAAEAPPPAPPPPPAPAPAPAPEPAPVAAEPPPLPAPAPVPEAAAAAAPAAENPFKVTVGAGLRAGVRIQNPNTRDDDGNLTKLNDQYIDELNAELRLSGKVTDIIGWTANLTVDGRTRAQANGGPIAFQAQALDLIGQLDFMDEFHVWLGRMLTPTDRSNFSGAWFMAPWNYSGALDAYYGPRGTEEVGREVGATVWGDIGKGKLKYYAMLGDLDSNVGPSGGFAGQSPLLALRAQYAVIGAEPGFYGSSTYYGGQDIVAIGAAFQYQKDYALSGGVDAMDQPLPNVEDNHVGFNADVLAEVKTGAGTPGIEAAYYHQSGETRLLDDFFYVVPGFTTTEVLPYNGKLNATVRFQMAKAGKDTAAERTTIAVEPSVAYLFKDYFAKLQLTYSFLKSNYADDEIANEANLFDNKQQFIQLGFQIQQ